MLDQQTTEAQQKRLPRSVLELCYQRATRGDQGTTLQGTLCRGEFLETILRIVKSPHQEKRQTAMYVQPFIDEYLLPQLHRSLIPKHRKLIHESVSLNAYLHANELGLEMIYAAALDRQGRFTIECA
jgi:hypothetical protein